MCKFRDLTPADIDIRVGRQTPKGISLLLYKDARVDMAILDETFGVENWQREHYECKGNLFCRVGVFFEGKGWVWKSDCGSESKSEKEKGEASDSFKRACTNFGIGRELYTSPFIWIKKGDYEEEFKNGETKCSDKFVATDIVIKNKVIQSVTIKNKAGKQFEFRNNVNSNVSNSNMLNINHLRKEAIGFKTNVKKENGEFYTLGELRKADFEKYKILNDVPVYQKRISIIEDWIKDSKAKK